MNSTVKHYPRNVYLRMHRKSACVETLKSLYQKWLPTCVRIVSKSAIKSYRIAYDHIQSIANIPINLIKYSDMQGIIDSMRERTVFPMPLPRRYAHYSHCYQKLLNNVGKVTG